MNIVKEFKDDGIDVDALTFAIFPFGTANDISRAFNWGKAPPKQMLRNLFKVCSELIEAKEEKFNIWEITIELDKQRGDVRVPDGKVLKSLFTNKLTKIMCHSMSFGLDSLIGLNFELKRTSSRTCNTVRYGLEGVKRLLN